MSIIGSNILAGASGQAGGGGAYEISRSVRFNSSDSAYLSKNFGSLGDRKTWTWAGWVKRSSLVSSYQALFNGVNSQDFAYLYFEYDAITFAEYNRSSITSAGVFRDPGAWFHVVLAYNTANATAADRIILYVNGARVSTSSYTEPPLNSDGFLNQATAHDIGRFSYAYPTYAAHLDGYLADIHFIDGQALDPTSFGEFDTNGVWQPKAYTGTYGTNGFHLDFADNSTAAALGTDTSGAGNNWTVHNISIITGGPTSVAAASAALPVYNTTDTYGATKGSGTRTDSNSSSIVLAVPMDGANNGTTFTDESATIKGSGSAKSITRNGDTKTVTAQSKFYGSSGYFDGNGDYLQVSNSADFSFGAGNFTFECWAYFNDGADRGIFGNSVGGELGIRRLGNGKLMISRNNVAIDTSSNSIIGSGAWKHLVIQRSGTTLKMFIDGIEDVSATNSNSYNCSNPRIGTNNGVNHNGYIQDLRIYKGVAKYTSNFNPPSSTQNATFAAGNDSLVDSPTNGSQVDTGVGGEVVGNYATLNPLGTAGATPTNGNLSVSSSSTVGNRISTFFLTNGKWYWEGSGNGYVATVVGRGGEGFTGSVSVSGSKAIGWYPVNGVAYWDGGSSGSGTTYSNTDVIGVALDMDAGTVKFYKNNTLIHNLTFGSGTVPNLSTGVFPGYNVGAGTTSVDLNFGQRPFAYTAPSGFKALCTTNLPTPTIADGSTVMDVVTYTGNGSTQTISGLNFSPDFVWIKTRSASGYAHILQDTVRGAGKSLASQNTNVEVGNAGDFIGSFNSDGFSVNTTYLGGTAPETNGNGDTYVAWTWDAGSSTVTNTEGSISSQVRANASAGFSVVTYTGTGANATVGHGLGVAPSMVIIKSRSFSQVWVVGHSSIGFGNYLLLNTTVASAAGSNVFNSTAPTSTVFSLGTGTGGNQSAATYVSYCFAPVSGYSAMGSYVGNGSSDGVFVYTGFRSRWILVKCSSAVDGWVILDSARDTYNLALAQLIPNLSNAEDTSNSYFRCDFLSNGFKLRTTGSPSNSNAATYIYAAFAESPFAYSRAR